MKSVVSYEAQLSVHATKALLTDIFILIVCPSLNPKSSFGPFSNSLMHFSASFSCFKCLKRQVCFERKTEIQMS